MAWIQLLRSVPIEKGGVSRTYYPGDWCDVGRQSAQRWVNDGVARWATPQTYASDLSGCGVALSGDASQASRLRTTLPQLAVELATDAALPFARTLFWETSFALRPELVPVGFGLLGTWEVAAPIVSYDTLAVHVGTPDARERTQAIIRDLRVPLYDGRLLFVKRCRAGEDLLAAWAEEQTTGDDVRLCLLRAIYQTRPLICALPVTWRKDAPAIV